VHRKSVYFLVVAVAALIVIGCVMLFSTSAFAQDTQGNPHFYIKRQFMWLAVGFVACVVAANVDYHFWQRTGTSGSVSRSSCSPSASSAIGARINGSARWIRAGGVTFQPSEMGQACVNYHARLVVFSRRRRMRGGFLKGFILPIGGTSILLALIAPEVDMGAPALIARRCLRSCFVAGHATALHRADLSPADWRGCFTSPPYRRAARGVCSRFWIWRNIKEGPACSSGRR
jgi:cell division protein FtsW